MKLYKKDNLMILLLVVIAVIGFYYLSSTSSLTEPFSTWSKARSNDYRTEKRKREHYRRQIDNRADTIKTGMNSFTRRLFTMEHLRAHYSYLNGKRLKNNMQNLVNLDNLKHDQAKFESLLAKYTSELPLYADLRDNAAEYLTKYDDLRRSDLGNSKKKRGRQTWSRAMKTLQVDYLNERDLIVNNYYKTKSDIFDVTPLTYHFMDNLPPPPPEPDQLAKLYPSIAQYIVGS